MALSKIVLYAKGTLKNAFCTIQLFVIILVIYLILNLIGYHHAIFWFKNQDIVLVQDFPVSYWYG
jgi:uncharacterized membrane protein YdbT with pleckstrin-like domain